MSKKYVFGYKDEASAFVVDDYPYGFRLRCKIRYWIETVKGKGDRFVSQTTNPKKAGEVWNKPKKSTYSAVMVMSIDERGYVSCRSISRGWSDEAKVNDFVEAIGGIGNLNENQLDELAICKAINETNKYVKVEIVRTGSMSEEERAAREEEQKKTKENINKLMTINYIGAKKELGSKI